MISNHNDFQGWKKLLSGSTDCEKLAILASHQYPIKFTRIYFGNEFCQELIPNINEVKEVSLFAKEMEIGFSLLCPYVTEKGITKLRNLFRYLNRTLPQTEIIINDWGVLYLLKKDYPSLNRILGRLMNKMVRDPRIAEMFNASQAPEAVRLAFRQSSLTNPRYREFLANQGISGVEFDCLLQGLEMDFKEFRFMTSLYLPFQCIATGRSCLVGPINLPKEQKFALVRQCGKECQRYSVDYNYRAYFSDHSQKFFYRGNTVFYKFEDRMIPNILKMAGENGIDRIVYQPEFPI